MAKKITVEDVAKIMGKSPQNIRIRMQLGLLKIGEVFKSKEDNTRYTYEIIPKMFTDYTGIVLPNEYYEV